MVLSNVCSLWNRHSAAASGLMDYILRVPYRQIALSSKLGSDTTNEASIYFLSIFKQRSVKRFCVWGNIIMVVAVNGFPISHIHLCHKIVFS